MSFWKLDHSPAALAAMDARTGQTWTYADLRRDVEQLQKALSRFQGRSLGVLMAQNRYGCLVTYLGALNSDCAVILVDADLQPELLDSLMGTYCPDWIFSLQDEFQRPGYEAGGWGGNGLLVRSERRNLTGAEIHPELALLLSTSGSTGSAKLVRLTHSNLAANAASIAQYLGLTAEERPITSLPMPYSYGLSVINSHLHAGAAIVLSEDGVLRREFWDAVERFGCTSFAGVPYTYQLLLQAGLLAKKGASLKTLTQAGGRLEPRYIEQMLKIAGERGWRFFVMYGQTEASPRMAYVPWERLREKVGAIGVAVPGGSLAIDAETGELIYSGPNTMLGYAESRADLAKGDELRGVLRTGDLGHEDADGFFYINGRLKRFLKLFGKRFNLDDVEALLARHFESALGCYGRDDLLMVALEQCSDVRAAADVICQLFALPRTAVKVIAMAELPRTANGKLDYQRLKNDAGERVGDVIR